MNPNEARWPISGNFKQQEDVKLHRQLQDYCDFQCYDLAPGDILRRFALQIYDNFRKPSWRTLKHYLFLVRATGGISPHWIKSIAEMVRKTDFRQDRMFGRLAKIPIGNTFSGLSEMGFVDFGDLSTVLRIRDTFARFSAISFFGGKEAQMQKW